MPMMLKIRSLPVTNFLNLPVRLIFIASGTLNQVTPLAIAQARSVEPTPVANEPRAPYVHVCESAPITRSPGRMIPLSGRITCSIPISLLPSS